MATTQPQTNPQLAETIRSVIDELTRELDTAERLEDDCEPSLTWREYRNSLTHHRNRLQTALNPATTPPTITQPPVEHTQPPNKA